jgi:hypothetical protein
VGGYGVLHRDFACLQFAFADVWVFVWTVQIFLGF